MNMADEELVALLKQGSCHWNEWRKNTLRTTPEKPDLRGAKLNGANLSGANFHAALLVQSDLRGARLDKANLSDAYLSYANLSRAILEGANLSNAKIFGASLGEANLSNATLEGADLREANLREAILNGAILNDADLSDANLTNANLTNADLSDANLERADLREANLRGANLRGAILNGADLIWANLRNAIVTDQTQIDYNWRLVWELQNLGGKRFNLRNTDLSGTDLSGVNFSHAILNDAHLDYANLSNTNLSGAKLINTDLTGVNLINANLHGADFTGADLTNAVMTGACIYEWKFSSHSNLEQVECDFVYLRPSQNERRPQSGSFGPGEFAEFLYEKEAERSSDSKSPGMIINNNGVIKKTKFEGPVHANIIGDNAHDNTIQQVNVGSQVDPKTLAKELTKLREYMAEQDTPDEYAAEVTAITKAESAAKKGDETSVKERLLKAGAWTLNQATQVGTPLLTAYLKALSGLP
jgi:uncharacterized protein YjbI with pentapeptide repeats